MKTLLLIAAITINGSLFSQCDFIDDYSTNTGWTQIGNDVEVVNNQLAFINGAIGGLNGAGQKRVYKSIGNTLNANDYWLAQFDFTPTAVGSTLGQPFTGHNLLALTAGTQEPFNDCPDIPCTGFPNGNQDGIIVYYGAESPPTGDVWIKIKARDNAIEYTSTNQINVNTLNITYYPKLERTSSTNILLSVFSDAARTTHITGSPINLTIPNTITGLTTVQHGNIARGNFQRELTGSIDNLCINFSPLSDNSVKSSLANPTIYPNPTAGQLTISLAKGTATAVTLSNSLGQLLLSEKHSANKQVVLDISAYPTGIYFLQVEVDGKVITKKVVKE